MDIAPIGMGNYSATTEIFNFLPVGLSRQMMRDVEATKFRDVVIAWHDVILLKRVCAGAQRALNSNGRCRKFNSEHCRFRPSSKGNQGEKPILAW